MAIGSKQRKTVEVTDTIPYFTPILATLTPNAYMHTRNNETHFTTLNQNSGIHNLSAVNELCGIRRNPALSSRRVYGLLTAIVAHAGLLRLTA